MTNPGPTLAVLVKKWLKTYSTKSQWDFSFAYDPKTKEQNIKEGYLTCWRFDRHEMPGRPAIKIKDDTAIIGQFGAGTYNWEREEWRESIYSGVKLIAADPRFFSKLDKVMQFLVRSKQRKDAHDAKFAQAELVLLKDILS